MLLRDPGITPREFAERYVPFDPNDYVTLVSMPGKTRPFGHAYHLTLTDSVVGGTPNRMLNLEYIGRDEADEEAFERRIVAMGLRSSSDAFATAFYPTVKREITQSWQRLFDSAEGCPDAYLEAGIWEIRREWIRSLKA